MTVIPLTSLNDSWVRPKDNKNKTIQESPIDVDIFLRTLNVFVL